MSNNQYDFSISNTKEELAKIKEETNMDNRNVMKNEQKDIEERYMKEKVNNSVCKEWDAELESVAHKTTQGPTSTTNADDGRGFDDPKERVLNQRMSDWGLFILMMVVIFQGLIVHTQVYIVPMFNLSYQHLQWTQVSVSNEITIYQQHKSIVILCLQLFALNLVIISAQQASTTCPGYIPNDDFFTTKHEQEEDECLIKYITRKMKPLRPAGKGLQRRPRWLVERVLMNTSRYCLKCSKIKPDRCHHCRICKNCVLRMDHHCPWINNCVGFYNQKQFISTVFWGTFMVAVLTFTMWEAVDVALNLPFVSAFQAVFVTINYVIQAGLFCLLFGFLLFHFYLQSNNQTTIEFCEKKRNAGPFSISPQDRGCMENCTSINSTEIQTWFCPLNVPQQGEGICQKLREKYTSEIKREQRILHQQQGNFNTLDENLDDSVISFDETFDVNDNLNRINSNSNFD